MEIFADLFRSIQLAQTHFSSANPAPALKEIQQNLLDLAYAGLPTPQYDICNAQLARADALRRAFRTASEDGPKNLIQAGIVRGLQIAALYPCENEPFPDFQERLSDILNGKRQAHFPLLDYPLLSEDGPFATAGFSEIHRTQLPIGDLKIDAVVKRYRLETLNEATLRCIPLGGFFHELRFQGAIDVYGNALSGSLRRVQVLDFGFDQSNPYVVLTEMKGGNGVELAEKMLTFDEAAKINVVREMIECVALAHRDGIIHRDISPKNFMRDEEGRIYLLDFGVSGTIHEIEESDENRFYYGPVLPPESLLDPSSFGLKEDQIHAEDLSTTFKQSYRSDVYSLCASILIMFTNRFDLKDAQYHQMILRYLSDSNAAEFSSIPESLRPLLKRGLSIEPKMRFINAADFLNELNK